MVALTLAHRGRDHPLDRRYGRAASAPARSCAIGRRNGLKPHLVRGFKVSRDPKFVEKLEDIVGLYMSPARARAGAVLRREEPDAGAGPHAARSAAEEGARAAR